MPLLSRHLARAALTALLAPAGCGVQDIRDLDGPWIRHTIDASSRGADGVRLADVNGDGWLDIATGWEEGGRIRVCIHPGPAAVRDPWPAVTVGEVGSPEDAVLVDLDADGALDVVSSCEGSVKTMYVHWAPPDPQAYLDADAWHTQPIPVTRGTTRWMFCLPMDVDGRHGVDLVAGAKNANAQIGWLEASEDARDLASWQWHPLRDAGWIMTLAAADLDRDGDLDIVASDRKGTARGCFWLENPGAGPQQRLPWAEHPIGAADKEVLFLVVVDLDQDGLDDVLVATLGHELILLRQQPAPRLSFATHVITLPPEAGVGKGVNVGDVDLDGRLDIVFTCEHAGGKSGVMWMAYPTAVTDTEWQAYDISGPAGTKYDLVELIDLDNDGDLDVLTCEERENLGVIWYENPARY